MSPILGKFSRRTFLGGASLAAAHAATPHLPRPALPVEILLEDDRDHAALEVACGFAALAVQCVTVRTPKQVEPTAAFLSGLGLGAMAVNPLLSRMPADAPGCRGRLLLGRWTGAERLLVPRLDARLAIYCDDPTLAYRLRSAAKALPPRSLVGLDAALDPRVELEAQRARAGLMGVLISFAVTMPPRHGVLAMEAAYIAGRLDPLRTIPLKLVETSNAPPAFHMSSTGGSSQMPLYSAAERAAGLCDRLRHFDAVARAEEPSRLSMQANAQHCAHLQPLL